MNRTGVLAAAVATFLASAAQADERLFLAGGELADTAYYSYAGLVLPGPGRENGRGLFQRYWVDALGYEYDGTPGRIEADAWGAEAAIGYGTSSAKGWGSASLGVRYTDTSLSPDDPKATARGSQVGVKVQFDGETEIAPSWRVGGIASYTTAQNGYWIRGRLMHRADSGTGLGAEAVANGNDEAQSTSVGLVLEFRPGSSRWTVSLKGGYRFQDDDDDSPYGGLDVGYGF
jgi:hypothetical protein